MNINEAFPSNYIKASDLQGRSAPVVISHVVMEQLGDDNKAVLYFFKKRKGMVLNKTNANSIASMYGEDTDGWEGKEITLYSAEVDFQGRMVEAIRIRAPGDMTVTAWLAQQKRGNGRPPVNQVATGGGETAHNDLDDEIPF